MIDNSEVVLTMGPFLGVDLSSGPTYLSQGKAAQVLNHDVSRKRGEFNPLFGRSLFLGQFAGTNSPSGFTRFIRDPSGALPNVYILAPSNGNTYQYALESGGAWTTFPFTGTASPPVSDGTLATFAKFDGYLYTMQRGPNSLGGKVSSALVADTWQIDAPDGLLLLGTPYQAILTATGKITSVGPTYYRFTYSNAYQESSPSLPVDVGPITTPSRVNFLFPLGPVNATTINLYRLDPGLPDWLLVGSLPNTQGTGNIPFTSNPWPIGYTPYLSDNTPSNLVTGQTLTQHRDRPAPFYSITRHKGRIWGFGYDAYNAKVSARIIDKGDGVVPVIPGTGSQVTLRVDLQRGGIFNNGDAVTVYFSAAYVGTHIPSFQGTIVAGGGSKSSPADITFQVTSTADAGFTISGAAYGASYVVGYTSLQPAGRSNAWYSNLYEPWGFDNVRQVVPVNPNDGEDIAVGNWSVGGTIVFLKSRSTWTLYGDSPSDNQTPQEVGHDLGCLAIKSVVQALGILFWLSNQGVQMFDGNSLTNLSPDIQDALDLLTEADILACAAHFHKATYWLSFPTKGVSYGYHLPSKQWTTSSYVSNFFSFDLEGTTNRPSSPDVVVSNFYGGPSPQLLKWYSGPTDIGGSITSIYTTHTWDAPEGEWWTFTYLQLIAQNLGVGLPPLISVTLSVNPNTPGAPAPWTRFITFARNPMLLVSIPNTQQGIQATLSLATTTTADFSIQKVRLFGRKLRGPITPDGVNLS